MSKTKFQIFPCSLQLQGSSSHRWMQSPFFYLISHPITSAHPACSAFKICTFLTTFMITTHSSHCFIFSCLRDSTWSMALLSSVCSQPAARLITFRIRLTTSCLCSTIPIFFLSPSEYRTQRPCSLLYGPFLWLRSLPSALGTPASLVPGICRTHSSLRDAGLAAPSAWLLPSVRPFLPSLYEKTTHPPLTLLLLLPM